LAGSQLGRRLKQDAAGGFGDDVEKWEVPNVRIEMSPIGFVRTDAEKVPRSFRVSEVEGTLEIAEAYREGLADVEPGQRIVVIFVFHESPEFSERLLRQTPPHRRHLSSRDDGSMGIFSICSPVRPNPVGMSILDVLEVEGTTVRVRGLDMKDGTPILDIKPWLGDGRDRGG
jgi:tRNA-Thr(GGU) m(6)t(6)A37 methyltransferase TsaA